MQKNRIVAFGLFLIVASSTAAWAAKEGVAGSWLTTTGDVVTIAECGKESNDLCLTVAKLSPTAGATTDMQNPDATLRDRPLCGLKIGDGFKPDSPNAASGGQI